MSEKNTFLKTAWGKIILAFVALVVVLAIIISVFSSVVQNSIISDVPVVVTESFENAKSSDSILSKIGEISSQEYWLNEAKPENDTLKFSIKLVGEKSTVTINAAATKKSDKDWKVFKSDTVFTK